MDAFPVFGSIVESSLADAFWVAGAVAETLFVGSFAKWSGRIVALLRLGSNTGGSGGLLFGIVLLWCLSGVLLVRMILLDRIFVPIGRLLSIEDVQYRRVSRHDGTFNRDN